jgi:hypothetical protein
VARDGAEHAGVTTLRTANQAKCERLLAKSALLEHDDLAWDQVGRAPLDDEVLNVLLYMRDVEGFTNREMVGLIAHPATLADPVVARFLECWRAEEHEHAKAVDRYLTHYARASASTCAVPRSRRRASSRSASEPCSC